MGVKSIMPTPEQLSIIFGDDSTGDTPELRALSSNLKFVRSQDHLALFSEGARGRVLSAWEALQAFGIDALVRVSDEKVISIVSDHEEPARTLRNQRTDLRIPKEFLANFLNLRKEDITDVENPRTRSPFEIVSRIATALGLDASVISVKAGANRDGRLTARLRTLVGTTTQFSPRDVLIFAQAAWVISIQAKLTRWIYGNDSNKITNNFIKNPNYGNFHNPAYRIGYSLAREARDLLHINPTDPINSMYKLCEETLLIPIIKVELPDKYAGATIAVRNDRGIILNTCGMNENVWIRRTTLAHELGHLLWDTEPNLQSISVDEYEGLFNNNWDDNDRNHFVEQRANAFAVEFIAPREGVLDIYNTVESREHQIQTIMNKYGVSKTTAIHHLSNIIRTRIEPDNYQFNNLLPSDEWKAIEGYTEDFFPIRSVPLERRGIFSAIVVKAHDRGYISEDTACKFLSCSNDDFRAKKNDIASLFTLPE